jgi:hypothetical protein
LGILLASYTEQAYFASLNVPEELLYKNIIVNSLYVFWRMFFLVLVSLQVEDGLLFGRGLLSVLSGKK